MKTVLPQLRNLQQHFSDRNEEWWPDEKCEKLFLTETNGLVHIEFYGRTFDESFWDFSRKLCQPEVAVVIKSLVFRGPDEGANGTKNWDFSMLLHNDVIFPNLTSLLIEPTQLHHHNQSIIGASYEEDGMIAALTNKMPQLESLTVPSAPNSSFFTKTKEGLRWLRIESGYAHQNFIQNLSRSKALPNLASFDFGDYCQNYIENYQDNCTPFAHYVELFQSQAFANISYFRLRNPSLSQEQLRDLKRLRSDLEFHVVQESGAYME
jgi:hypothetical protein